MLPAIEELLLELARRGVGLIADGEKLLFSPRSAVTPELLALLRDQKAAVLAIVRESLRSPCENDSAETADGYFDGDLGHGPERWCDAITANDGESRVTFTRADRDPWPDPWESAIDPPPPCPRCGSLEMWWNVFGDMRCMKCDPPTTSIKLQELATKLRKRQENATGFDRRANER